MRTKRQTRFISGAAIVSAAAVLAMLAARVGQAGDPAFRSTIDDLRRLHESVPNGATFASSRDEWYKRFELFQKYFMEHRDAATREAAAGFVVGHWKTRYDEGVQGGDFFGEMECGILATLITERDRPRLVRLLSRVPIETDMPDGYYIEYSLATWDAFPAVAAADGMLVVFDAYYAAENDGARAAMLAAIRRAFHSEIRAGEAPDAFVSRCKEWIVAHKREIEINPEYRLSAIRDDFNAFASDSNDAKCKPPPLFLMRGEVAREKK